MAPPLLFTTDEMPDVRLRRGWLAWLAVLLLAPAHTIAQSIDAAQVAGRVTTAAGAPAVGARVTARAASLAGERTTTAGADGAYLLAGLPPGDYVVSTELAGFIREVRTFTLAARQTISLASVLSPVPEADDHDAVRIRLDRRAADDRPLADAWWRDALDQFPVASFVGAARRLSATPAAAAHGRAAVDAGSGLWTDAERLAFRIVRDAVETLTVTGAGDADGVGAGPAGAIAVVLRSGAQRAGLTGRATVGTAGLDADQPEEAVEADGAARAFELTARGPLVAGRTVGTVFGATAADGSPLSRRVAGGELAHAVSDNARLSGTMLLARAAPADGAAPSTAVSGGLRAGLVAGPATVTARVLTRAHDLGGVDGREDAWLLSAQTIANGPGGHHVLTAGHAGRRAELDDERTGPGGRHLSVFAGDRWLAGPTLTIDGGLSWHDLRAASSTPGGVSEGNSGVGYRLGGTWAMTPDARWRAMGHVARSYALDGADAGTALRLGEWVAGIHTDLGMGSFLRASVFRQSSRRLTPGLGAADPDVDVDGLSVTLRHRIGVQLRSGASYLWSDLRDAIPAVPSHRIRVWAQGEPLIDDDTGVLTVTLLGTLDADIRRLDAGVTWWRPLPGTVYGRLLAELHLLNVFDDVNDLPIDPASSLARRSMPRAIRVSIGVRY